MFSQGSTLYRDENSGEKKIYDLEKSGKDFLKDALGMLTLQQPVFTGHSVLVLMVNTFLAEVRQLVLEYILHKHLPQIAICTPFKAIPQDVSWVTGQK